MSSFREPKALLDHLERSNLAGREQRAFVMAQVLQHCQVIIAGSKCPDLVKRAGFHPGGEYGSGYIPGLEAYRPR